MFAVLDAIRRAGDEIINGLFWIDAGVLGSFLLGGIGIILHIVWGLLVYSSPIWLPLLVYWLYKSGRRSAARQAQEKAVADHLAGLADALCMQIVNDFASGNVKSMADFGAFMRRGSCKLTVTPTEINLTKPGLAAVYRREFREFKFEFAGANNPNDEEMRKKVLRLAQMLHSRLGAGLELKEETRYNSNMKQVPVQRSKVVEDIYGNRSIETRTEYESRGSVWVEKYWVEIMPTPAPKPAAPQPKSDVKVI